MSLLIQRVNWSWSRSHHQMVTSMHYNDINNTKWCSRRHQWYQKLVKSETRWRKWLLSDSHGRKICVAAKFAPDMLSPSPDHQTSWHNKHQTTYLITLTMKLQDLMIITCWEFGGDKYLVVTKSSDIEWQVYQACRVRHIISSSTCTRTFNDLKDLVA